MNRRNFLKLFTSAVALGLIGSYPVLIERNLVQVNRYRIPVPKLPRPFEGLTIVQLTDLHHGALVSLDFIKGVAAKAREVKADIIACTGDFVHGRSTRAEVDRVWPVLSELEAPLGVYSVLGNHDHWAGTSHSLDWLERSGQNLRFRTHCLERNGQKLWLAGGGDYMEDHRNFDEILKNIPAEDCRIVLAHNPDSADTAFSRRIDLMICGHTHGGQIVIPFWGPPVLPVKNKNYSFGLKANSKNQPVFISKGIGWSIYPVRFNCYPEIAVLELTRAA